MSSRQIEQRDHSLPGWSRRKVVETLVATTGIAGLASIIYAVGARFGGRNLRQFANLKDVPQPDKTETIQETDEFTMYFNDQGTPIRFVRPDGQIIVFDVIQKREFIEARWTAMAFEEPEVATILSVPCTDSVCGSDENIFPNDPEQNPPHALPEDTLSEQELAVRGIDIIPTPNFHGHWVKLHLRRGAFMKGELLEDYKEDSRKKLALVLVPGPIVDRDYLQDSRYNRVRNIVPQVNWFSVIDRYRKLRIAYHNSEIVLIRQEMAAKFKTIIPSLEQQADYMDLIVNEKISLALYEKALSETDLKNELIFMPPRKEQINFQPAAGVYYPKGLGDGHPVIFLAVGHDHIPKKAYLAITVSEKGKFSFKISTRYGMVSGTEYRPEDNPINPYRITLNPDPDAQSRGDYLILSRNWGEVAIHELVHNQKKLNEYWTDMITLSNLLRAYGKFRLEQDTSIYYIVFETEKGDLLSENNLITAV